MLIKLKSIFLADIMASDDAQTTALANALKRQKELQDTVRTATDTIKAAMQELDRTRQFIDMFRSFTTPSDSGANIGSLAPSAPASRKLKGHAHGQVQAVFEALVLDILRTVGRPMKSTEFIEEFRKLGHPLGGNEVRTAWNRLWYAKRAGLLTYDVKVGYWIPGEPITEEMRLSAVAAAKRNRGKAPSLRDTIGKRKGPPAALTPDQVREAEQLLLSGKSRKEVCELYGGISMATLANYVGRTADFMARHPGFVPPKPLYRPPRPGQKRGGRPRNWTADQERQVLEMRTQKKSVREIIEATGVKRTTIYKIFDEHGVEVRESPMRLINRSGEELKIGDTIIHPRTGSVGKIEGFSGPNAVQPKGVVRVIWAGNVVSDEMLPVDIDAAFK